VAVAAWRGDARLPGATPQALLIWCGAVLGTLYAPLIIVGIVGAGPARRRQERREPVLRPAAGAVAATGLILAVAANIHGAHRDRPGVLTTGGRETRARRA